MAADAGEMKALTIEEAIKTAIEFETKVRNLYREAMIESKDDMGKRIFRVLAKEEQTHLDYLNDRLAELSETGKVTAVEIGTKIPPKEKIEAELKGLKKSLEKNVHETEIKLLSKAVDVESQTSSFYQRMVKEMSGEAKKMFANFMEIEEGHVAIVQAELDAANGLGFYFGVGEFNLEME